jgi:hypothetical protein
LKDSIGKRAENKEEAKKLKKIDFFSRYNLLKCVLRLFMNSEDNQLIVMIEAKLQGPPSLSPSLLFNGFIHQPSAINV